MYRRAVYGGVQPDLLDWFIVWVVVPVHRGLFRLEPQDGIDTPFFPFNCLRLEVSDQNLYAVLLKQWKNAWYIRFIRLRVCDGINGRGRLLYFSMIFPRSNPGASYGNPLGSGKLYLLLLVSSTVTFGVSLGMRRESSTGGSPQTLPSD